MRIIKPTIFVATVAITFTAFLAFGVYELTINHGYL